ncbi:MAG: VWA domain-containing protein [Ruminococcus sp.]|nr:VWA domain-containing protein [Ruminococcus sp.]
MNETRKFGSTIKRLPIVFCLDVSPSMNWDIDNRDISPMELLNQSVNTFISEINTDGRTRSAAEVAYVSFSTNIEVDSPFMPARNLDDIHLKTVAKGGTNMAQAVLRSYEKLDQRIREYAQNGIRHNAPFFVLVTDGNPDDNDDNILQDRAIATVNEHCNSHQGADGIVIPFIVGVGRRVDKKTLLRYSEGFTNGFFHIRGNSQQVQTCFSDVFRVISNSTKASVHLNLSANEVIESIRATMNNGVSDLDRELAGI